MRVRTPPRARSTDHMTATPTYFERIDDHRFRPTEHVGGAWTTAEQHISPLNGLIVHAVETNGRAARRRPGHRPHQRRHPRHPPPRRLRAPHGGHPPRPHDRARRGDGHLRRAHRRPGPAVATRHATRPAAVAGGQPDPMPPPGRPRALAPERGVARWLHRLGRRAPHGAADPGPHDRVAQHRGPPPRRRTRQRPRPVDRARGHGQRHRRPPGPDGVDVRQRRPHHPPVPPSRSAPTSGSTPPWSSAPTARASPPARSTTSTDPSAGPRRC